MTSLSIIMPSRLKRRKDKNRLFLQTAHEAIFAQTLNIPFKIFVGVDPDAEIPDDIPVDRVQICKSKTKSLSGAINAAAANIDGDYVAFYEDDDVWLPEYLKTAMQALDECGFVSSTQLEVDLKGNVRRINDFATPCTWVMPRSTWETVGKFSEDYAVHQDNDWLGRLAQKKIKRIHLVESTAPIDPEIANSCRPWLGSVVGFGGPCSTLKRHSWPYPLVSRVVHSDSWLGRIDQKGIEYAQSNRCFERLKVKYGTIPW